MPSTVELVCENCKKEFKRLKKHTSQKKTSLNFCETKCYYEYVKKTTPKTENVCPVCGKTKEVRLSDFKRNGHICCSKKCGWIRERRRKVIVCNTCGKEREAIEAAWEGENCFECNMKKIRNKVSMICPVCGKIFERGLAAKKRMKNSYCSKGCAGVAKKGEGCYLWKGGVSSELRRARVSAEYKRWRTSVFERDNYTCRDCGIRGTHLHPHHIKEFALFPSLRYEVSNGVTLCEKCHGKIHGINYASRASAKS